MYSLDAYTAIILFLEYIVILNLCKPRPGSNVSLLWCMVLNQFIQVYMN